MSIRLLLLIAAVAIVGCGQAPTAGKDAGGGPTGWDVTNAMIPKGIGAPILEGGLVLNSYRDRDRVVVTLVYESLERNRISAAYDAWLAAADGVKSGRGFEIWGRIVWSDSWTVGRSEARMSECLNESTGEFDNLCVALTTWVGSVP